MKEQFTPGEWGFQANDSYMELHAGGKMIGDLCMGQNTCTKEELEANAQLFKVAPKMYHMIESLKSELMWMITNENNRRKANSSITDLQPRDQLDAESVYLADKLLAEARGENNDV